MNLIRTIVLLTIATVFISCGDKKENTTVSVGMTYEEVETVLGKPVSILRGINVLSPEVDSMSDGTTRVINTDTTETETDSNRWFALHKVKTDGETMYVSWVYDKEKTENYYVMYNNYKEGETITKKVPVYYLGDKKVTKEEYNAATGSLYIEPGAGKQQNYETGGKTKVPMDSLKLKQPKMKDPQTKGKMIEKRIEYVTKTVGKSEAVIESVDKVNYEVGYKLCVVFDASSGRVTQYDYFPFTIK